MLSNRWLKDHIQIAENYRMLYAKFHALFKNIQRKLTTKFLSTLVLSLALEKIFCAKPCYVTILFKTLFSSQS